MTDFWDEFDTDLRDRSEEDEINGILEEEERGWLIFREGVDSHKQPLV